MLSWISKKNIALNCCKSLLKLLSIEAVNQLPYPPIEILKDKLKTSAKKKFDSSEAKKLVTSFKQFGKFKIQYLKKNMFILVTMIARTILFIHLKISIFYLMKSVIRQAYLS